MSQLGKSSTLAPRFSKPRRREDKFSRLPGSTLGKIFVSPAEVVLQPLLSMVGSRISAPENYQSTMVPGQNMRGHKNESFLLIKF